MPVDHRKARISACILKGLVFASIFAGPSLALGENTRTPFVQEGGRHDEIFNAQGEGYVNPSDPRIESATVSQPSSVTASGLAVLPPPEDFANEVAPSSGAPLSRWDYALGLSDGTVVAFDFDSQAHQRFSSVEDFRSSYYFFLYLMETVDETDGGYTEEGRVDFSSDMTVSISHYTDYPDPNERAVRRDDTKLPINISRASGCASSTSSSFYDDRVSPNSSYYLTPASADVMGITLNRCVNSGLALYMGGFINLPWSDRAKTYEAINGVFVAMSFDRIDSLNTDQLRLVYRLVGDDFELTSSFSPRYEYGKSPTGYDYNGLVHHKVSPGVREPLNSAFTLDLDEKHVEWFKYGKFTDVVWEDPSFMIQCIKTDMTGDLLYLGVNRSHRHEETNHGNLSEHSNMNHNRVEARGACKLLFDARELGEDVYIREDFFLPYGWGSNEVSLPLDPLGSGNEYWVIDRDDFNPAIGEGVRPVLFFDAVRRKE